MKLLFDQNISFRLINKIKDLNPDSFQVRELGLENTTDFQIWNFAKKNKMSIVIFDSDFYDLSLIKGHPPQIIWLRTGNTTTKNLEILFRKNYRQIREFLEYSDRADLGCLIINDKVV